MNVPFLEKMEGENITVNVSGGRTSAYMLWRILEESGGQLPENALAVFMNTGKERQETLDFLREIEARWKVPILWLEYRFKRSAAGGRHDPRHTAVKVDFHTASRNGEPFEQLIGAKSMLPNVAMRFCTSELKVHTVDRYVRRELDWKSRYWNVLGIRADEPKRVRKALFEECRTIYPLHAAGVTKTEVMEFWSRQPFDLQIHSDQGNCDLCFLKGAKKLVRLIRDDPGAVDWWQEQERAAVFHKRVSDAQATFSNRRSYAELEKAAKTYVDQLDMFHDADDEVSCFCGD